MTLATLAAPAAAVALGATIAFLVAARRARAARLRSPLPPMAGGDSEPPATVLAWVGTGTAEIWRDGAWRRAPAQDYGFSVIQNRFAAHWESVKTMHYRHPDYDGAAGSRDQTHRFRVDFGPAGQGEVAMTIQGSMGSGGGTTDPEFRQFAFAMDSGATGMAARFMPYDRLEFEQSYLYEEGRLEETITLVKAASGAVTPFLRITERAALLAPGGLAAPPTRAAAA